MSVFIFIIVIVGLVTCGEVVSKALDHRTARPAIDPGRDVEVSQLREQVESLASEVARLTEEQRFMTRLLEGSGSGSAVSERDEAGGRT